MGRQVEITRKQRAAATVETARKAVSDLIELYRDQFTPNERLWLQNVRSDLSDLGERLEEEGTP